MASAQKMVFKISIYCSKCKTAILKSISKLEGIDQVTIDAEKGTVTVIGNVDPVCVVEQLRKVRRPASIDTVGPNKPPEKKEEKKECKELPACCNHCSGHTIIYTDSVPGCSIV